MVDPQFIRLRLDFGYDGTAFSGWARQPGRRTVEGELMAGLGQILRLPEGSPHLTVAGRTDAGVHARGAVAHADVPFDIWACVAGRAATSPETAVVRRLGGVLPSDIVVHAVRPAPPGFDARFAALARHYRYRLCDRPWELDPLRRVDTTTHRRELDVAAMDRAARRLCGLRDFAAFCKRRNGATTIRTLLEYRWARTAEGILEATVVADAFCHSMVRALVGAVIPVGESRRDEEWPLRVQQDARRDSAVAVMPARGLCLERVDYPEDGQYEARIEASRSRRTPCEGASPRNSE